MRSTISLYRLAERRGVPVERFTLPLCGSMSLCSDGRCCIALDRHTPEGSVEERVHLAHELGHCLTGSFYNRYSPYDLRLRHENRADRWAVRKLITPRELDAAVAQGHTELWDLAEHFGVTEDLMRKAVCLYPHGNLAAELYF